MEYAQDFNGTISNSIRQNVWETSYDKLTGPGDAARSPDVWVIRERRRTGAYVTNKF